MTANEKPAAEGTARGLREDVQLGSKNGPEGSTPSHDPEALPSLLECELLARAGFPSREALAALRGSGVPDGMIAEVREADARYFPLRRWDFAADGLPSLVLPVRDAFGDVLDVAAWPIHRPEKWARLLGRAVLLGEASLGIARGGEPVPCWRTPLAWLNAGGDGIVILDPASAWLRLRPGPPLLAEDNAHAADIRATLSGPPVQPVRPRAIHRRAAA